MVELYQDMLQKLKDTGADSFLRDSCGRSGEDWLNKGSLLIIDHSSDRIWKTAGKVADNESRIWSTPGLLSVELW